MPTTKSFKINIESIVPINIVGLDLSVLKYFTIDGTCRD
jgi:hypothetical protein